MYIPSGLYDTFSTTRTWLQNQNVQNAAQKACELVVPYLRWGYAVYVCFSDLKVTAAGIATGGILYALPSNYTEHLFTLIELGQKKWSEYVTSWKLAITICAVAYLILPPIITHDAAAFIAASMFGFYVSKYAYVLHPQLLQDPVSLNSPISVDDQKKK